MSNPLGVDKLRWESLLLYTAIIWLFKKEKERRDQFLQHIDHASDYDLREDIFYRNLFNTSITTRMNNVVRISSDISFLPLEEQENMFQWVLDQYRNIYDEEYENMTNAICNSLDIQIRHSNLNYIDPIQKWIFIRELNRRNIQNNIYANVSFKEYLNILDTLSDMNSFARNKIISKHLGENTSKHLGENTSKHLGENTSKHLGESREIKKAVRKCWKKKIVSDYSYLDQSPNQSSSDQSSSEMSPTEKFFMSSLPMDDSDHNINNTIDMVIRNSRATSFFEGKVDENVAIAEDTSSVSVPSSNETRSIGKYS